MIISKNYKNCIEIKFEIENGEFVRQKLWVENFESKILSDFKLNKTSRMDLDAANEMMSCRSQYNITCKLLLWNY